MAIHRDLPASEVHEAKQIIGAVTADAGKVITPSGSSNGVGELRNLATSEITGLDVDLATLTNKDLEQDGRLDDLEARQDSFVCVQFPDVNTAMGLRNVMIPPGSVLNTVYFITEAPNTVATSDIIVQYDGVPVASWTIPDNAISGDLQVVSGLTDDVTTGVLSIVNTAGGTGVLPVTVTLQFTQPGAA